MEEFENCTNGKKPNDWQLNAIQALLLGLYCVTMPFVMPLLMPPKKHIVIISLLNALESDQVFGRSERRISQTQERKNNQTANWSNNIDFPEMSLQHSGFWEVLTSPKLATHISAIFHEEYSRLGTLQAFVPSQVPVLVASATMPPHILKQVCTTMHIDIKTSYYLNLGVDQPNITWEVRHMRAGKSNFESLQLVLPKKFGGEVNENDFKQTMVFGDDINDIVLEWYAMGKITVLFMTEAVGMVCDLPHIELVVQFLVPASLSIWMQRAGRAGRSPTLQACGVLLVQSMVFH
ncbi:hypothetical protein V8E55_010327 [Tylopilus felleus]